MAPAVRKDAESVSSHCRWNLQFPFINTNVAESGIHVNLIPDVKRRVTQVSHQVFLILGAQVKRVKTALSKQDAKEIKLSSFIAHL